MMLKACIVVGACLLCFFLGTLNTITTEIQEVKYNYNQPTTINGLQVNGYFDPTSGILTVFTQNKTQEQVEHTLLHELGHYIDYVNTNNIIIDEKFAEDYAVKHKIIGSD